MINKGTGDDCLGTDGHGFEKGTAGLRDGKGLICLKAILKYRHGSLTLVKKSVLICANLWTKKLSGKENCELAPASRNHEVPCIISIRSQKPCL